ncbi:MAG TPA: DUF3592 domain-containing protein [Candidatus Sulfotelmatobacter sp.]|nr:DUF3592 domain-containing protein [Candidatus Sulfotelmatobacter sp.]
MKSQSHDDSALGGDAPGPYDDVSRILPGMPQPRPVRMSFRGKVSALLIPGVLLTLTALTAKDYFHPTASWQKETFVSFFRLLCGLAIVLGLLQWRIYVRHRHLISNGDAVLGRITKNYGSARNGQYVRYQFNTQSGETLSKIRTSWKLLDIGMRIPVFYDPYNPKKQVALFAAYYEVELREQAGARCPPSTAKSL